MSCHQPSWFNYGTHPLRCTFQHCDFTAPRVPPASFSWGWWLQRTSRNIWGEVLKSKVVGESSVRCLHLDSVKSCYVSLLEVSLTRFFKGLQKLPCSSCTCCHGRLVSSDPDRRWYGRLTRHTKLSWFTCSLRLEIISESFFLGDTEILIYKRRWFASGSIHPEFTEKTTKLHPGRLRWNIIIEVLVWSFSFLNGWVACSSR